MLKVRTVASTGFFNDWWRALRAATSMAGIGLSAQLTTDWYLLLSGPLLGGLVR
jgi:hypothetical protein